MSARTVVAPREHEGVGAALRSVYRPPASNMPGTIADLLAKLN